MVIQLENVQGEEREGYYVQPLMKRIWAVQLDMLKEIDRICRCHQIGYYGWYGTLLGAVRHHGFIPWDDDLDLAMLREDHERFRYYMKTELPEGWAVFEKEPTLVTVFNTHMVTCLDQQFLDRFHGLPYMTGIDIFSLDGVPKDQTQEQLWLNLFWAVYSLCSNWDLPEEDEQWEDMDKWACLKEIERISGYHFDMECPIKEQLSFLGDRIAAMYWDTEYDDVTNIGWMHDRPHYRIPKSSFSKVIRVPFEDTTIPIPEDYDRICRLTYGDDYMTPIKIYKHDYLKKQVDHLRKQLEAQGEVLPKAWDMEFEGQI